MKVQMYRNGPNNTKLCIQRHFKLNGYQPAIEYIADLLRSTGREMLLIIGAGCGGPSFN